MLHKLPLIPCFLNPRHTCTDTLAHTQNTLRNMNLDAHENFEHLFLFVSAGTNRFGEMEVPGNYNPYCYGEGYDMAG